MLVRSAVGGEAAAGLVKGYDIAAKTGTANIAGPNGQYLQGTTIASIVGYAPAYHPRIAVLVIVRHPRQTPWGSMAAAPALHNLLQDLFMYYHIPPSPHALNK
jgi:cell division protein FtsI/penicillin-binding protein 2